MVDWWSRSPAHISPAIVTTHVSLGPAVPPRVLDMNSLAFPPCPAFSTDPFNTWVAASIAGVAHQMLCK